MTRKVLAPMSTDTISPPPIGSTFGTDSPRARRTDPTTSHEAADHNDVETSIGLVLSALRSFGPSADHELVQLLGQSGFTPQRLRTARAALVERRLVEEAGYYRLTDNNRRAMVWQAVTA